MRLFYFLLNAACLNAFVLWNVQNPSAPGQLNHHRRFLTAAAERIIRPCLNVRAATPIISHMPTIARVMLSIEVTLLPHHHNRQQPKNGDDANHVPAHKIKKWQRSVPNAMSGYVGNMAEEK